MEIIKAIWIINFFFFGFILFFVWSKITIIRKKISVVTPIIEKIEEFKKEEHELSSSHQTTNAEQETDAE